MQLTISDVSQLLKAMHQHNRTAEVDWTNRSIRVLSDLIPTMKKDGTRLHLSSGPAFHQEVLFSIEHQPELPFDMQDLEDKR